MKQLAGGDAFFLYTDKQSRHQQISAIYFYDQSERADGPLRFKTIMEHVEQRLGGTPFFRQKLVNVPFNLDYPYWINDPDFDLEFHVRHIALPQPGDWRQLCIQLSRLHSIPLDMSRPVWEMYVIEGLNNIDFLPANSFAIMLKIHHVAMDGVATANMTMELHDTEPNPTQTFRPRRWRPGQQPSTAALLTRALSNNIKSSIRTGQTVFKSLTREDDASFPASSEPVPETRFNQPISANRVWDAVTFDLEELKSIKNTVPGCTINDVVLAICGGAMTRYLESKNETPETSLTSLVPVSVRNTTEKSDGGNKVHLTRTSLHTREKDPLKRLAAITQEMKHVKARNAVGAREMVEMQDKLPAPTLLLAGKLVAASRGPGKSYRLQHNMVVTNIPGPQQPLYFCGARLANFSGMAVIIDNLAISHTVTSYQGQLTIAPLSDRVIMPDPAFYADCLRDAFTELKTSASKEQ